MSNYETDPVTGIKIPTVGSDPGPDYATHVSDALQTLAHLTHTGVSNLDGYQIPSAGINFNDDISAQSNNLTTLRSTRFDSQASTLNGTGDIDCVYVSNNDLYYNNGTGTPVQITSGNSLDTVSDNNYVVTATAINLSINVSDTTTVVSVNCSSNDVTITLPVIGSVPTGRYYIVKDTNGASQGTYKITVVASGGGAILDGKTSYVIQQNYAAVTFISNGTSWMVVRDNTQLINNTYLKARNNANSAYNNLIGANTSDECVLGSSSTFNKITGGLRLANTTISTNYTIDSGDKDIIIFVLTSVTAISITLPSGESLKGRTIVIKDVDGMCHTNNITLVRAGSEYLEGVQANKVLTTNFGSWMLTTDSSGNWWMI